MKSTKSLKDQIEKLREENRKLNSELSDKKNRENRFKTIFETSKLGNKIISSELVILEVNPALVKLLGYDDEQDVIGTKILDYSPEDHQKHWSTLQKELWEKETPYFNLETCLVRKDGSMVWVHVTSVLFKDEGETYGYTLLEDITRQYQEKLKKEEFISVASHELKTPITTMKASLQLMNRMIGDEKDFPSKILKLSQDAEKYTAKLSHLVGDLLNLSNFEQGQMTLNKTMFKLSDLLDECCHHVRLEGRYTIAFKGNQFVEVFADKYKIDQVLVNLVNNAIKYAPDSTEIIIKVDSLKNFHRISVIDKGKGISAANIPHLFERYYQVNKKGKNPGLGLGLYISAEIVRSHEGEIGVKSELGNGSTFWFTIPK
ncbi:PAS domain-containing sensor histidine kinase [Pedobacter sp. P351]|uniref:PAS domain-containing sensor histidine kinase n=1 Tax=Pedobacter superstes TaxID=3133441 RepID=UPI00309D3CBD